MSFVRTMLHTLATVTLASGLAAMPQPVSAADDGPDGSWRQSCRSANVRDGILYAECRRADGRYLATSARIDSCQGFGNRNGELFCETQGTANDTLAREWRGSFRETCTDITADKQGSLKARCRKDNGTTKTSNLSLWKCMNRQAANRDGDLVCEKAGSASSDAGKWEGSFRGSCRDISSDSAGTLTATCQAANGSWRRSNLSVRQCGNYRAGNRDGTLFCESQHGGTAGANQWQGSFRQSCREISSDSRGSLTATCQAIDGSWVRSTQSSDRCGSYLAGNIDGRLFCESPERPDASATEWQGSFRESCRDISIDSARALSATCQAGGGIWQRSKLSRQECRSHLAGNRNGTLFCESRGGNATATNQWQGSFRQSCRDLSSDGAGTLTATCQAPNGNWQRSSLSVRQCSNYRAGNRNGTLFCESTDGSTVGVNQWQGSFRQSCRDSDVSTDSAGTLTATCQTANGNWRRSSLSVRQCNSYLAGNRDGNLFCESPDGSTVGADQWQGSFRQSCRDVSDSSGTLTATCQMANGNWQRSSLSVRQCSGRVVGNRDGRLFCEG